MFSSVLSVVCTSSARLFSISSKSNMKVAVLGASGGIGQPLSLLMKQHETITHLALYDISPLTAGVAVDLSHVNTLSRVTGHTGPEQLCECLQGAVIVVIPAGMPRKPGMTRDELFNTNASIVRDLTKAIAQTCPKALIAIITNPVNSLVPIACEVLRKAGVLDPNRVFGVTTLDVIRAAAFMGEINCEDPLNIIIPVIGGHSNITMIPVLSQARPVSNIFVQDKTKHLIKRIQEAGTEVVDAKAGAGSATLSMAFAAARFTFSLIKGLQGECNVMECSYVQSSITESKYFASPLVLGKNGIEKNLGIGKLNDYENELLETSLKELQKNIMLGEKFVSNG